MSAFTRAAASARWAYGVVWPFAAALATSVSMTELDAFAPGFRIVSMVFAPICTCAVALYAGVSRLETKNAAPTATTTATTRIQIRRRRTPT